MTETEDLQREIASLRVQITHQNRELELTRQEIHLREQEILGFRATMDAVIDQMEASTRAVMGFQKINSAMAQRLDLMEKRVRLLSNSREGEPVARKD